jgi:hypothetical protein
MTADPKETPMQKQVALAKTLLWDIAEDSETSRCLRTDLHRVIQALTIEWLNRLPKKENT